LLGTLSLGGLNGLLWLSSWRSDSIESSLYHGSVPCILFRYFNKIAEKLESIFALIEAGVPNCDSKDLLIGFHDSDTCFLPWHDKVSLDLGNMHLYKQLQEIVHASNRFLIVLIGNQYPNQSIKQLSSQN